MKIVSFQANGKLRYGVLKGDGIVAPDDGFMARCPDARSLLEQDAVAALASAVEGKSPTVKAKDAHFAPSLPNPKKIFCVGLNYKTHVAETKRPDAEHPSIFTRFADSLTAHEQPILFPFNLSKMIDFEGELAVIIGKGGRNIAQKDALGHVAGYSCFNDGTVRDWQRHTHQWTPGKNFASTGALGPALVTADEVGKLEELELTTRLNGEVMQHASLSDLIFPIPLIIEYLSTFTPLSPGDVIATGTPGGVGDRRQPPVYMKAGDVIEVEITRVGTLRNVVTAA